MTLKWPDEIPSSILYKGHNESFGDNVIRQGMSTGPPKRRRRTTSAPRPVDGSIVMYDFEVAMFDDWYTDELGDGVFPFEFVEPRTGFVWNTFFREKPSWSGIGKNENGKIFQVNVKLGLLSVAPYTSQIPFIHFPFTSDLVDSKGAIGNGVFTRESAATYFDPNNFDCLMAANGEYEQIVPLESQTPDGVDAWWTHSGLILDNGALIGNDVDGYHTMRAVDKLESYNSYMMVVKVKPADKRWVFMRFDDAVLNKQVRIHLDTGEISSLTSGADAGIDGPDEDGYFTCWLVAYVLDTTVEGKNSIYFYPVVDSSTPTYQGDNSTVDLYIKEFNVFKLPAHMAYGPEEVTDSGMDDPSAWTVGYWTVSGGVATVAVGYGGNFYQQLPGLELGALYRISVQIGGMTTGHVRVSTANGAFYIDGDLNPEIRWEANGTHVRYMTCVDEASIVLWANSTFDGWIDNVSVKRVPNYLAHQIFGPEVLPVEARNPDDTDVLWNQSRCSISSDGGIIGNTEDNYHTITSSNFTVWKNNTRHLVSLKAKAGDKNFIRIRLYDGAIQSVVADLSIGEIVQMQAEEASISATSDENGYFTIQIIYKTGTVSNGLLSLYPYISLSDGDYVGDNSTVDIYVKEISVKKYEPDPSPLPYTTELSVPAEPCFETNGLRIVPLDFANYIEYSEQFDEWDGACFGGYTLAVLDPRESYGGAALIQGTGVQGEGVTSPGGPNLVIGDQYTVSVFLKFLDSTTVRLAVYSGVIQCSASIIFTDGNTAPTVSGSGWNLDHYKIEEVFNNWYRISFTATAWTDGVHLFRINPDWNETSESVYAFGANLTKSPQVLPYVPSYGAVTIMAEEHLEYDGCSDLDNILEGTVNEGSVVATVVPAYHHDDLDQVQRIVRTDSTTAMITFRGSGSLGFTDGNVITHGSCDYEENEILEFIAAWKKDLRTRVKRIQVLRNGQWYNSDYEEYVGEMPNSSKIILGGVNNVCPFHIKDLKFFKKAIFR